MDLLSPLDLAEIQSAFADLADTFMKNEIIYRKAGQHFDRFMESNEGRQYQDYTLRCLLVDGKTATESQVSFETKGREDLTEKYFLLYFADLEQAGLTNPDRTLNMSADTDFVIFNGEQLEIKSIVSPPDLSTEKSIVKIYFRNNI